MDYKKILKSRETRLAILKMLSFIPDKTMLKIQYKMKLGRKPDIDNPKRYTEWLQWYKINYKNNNLIRCVDKYDVRTYVEEIGLGSILNECYGIYDSVDEVDFDALPDQFVAKDTLGGGGNYVTIVKDKNSFDLDTLKKQMKSWTDEEAHAVSGGREWPYYSGKNHRIVIERYLEEADGDLKDYKFMCFNGKVECIVYDCDRFTDHKRNFYDSEWNYIKVDSDHECFEDSIPKPENLDKMIEIANQLSKEFPHVRVDLYNVNGKIYFGELTFYPWSGYVQYSPDSFDFDLGKHFKYEV